MTHDPNRPLGTVGRYDLRRELGRGATGIVYEAYDRESRSIVALKTLVSMDAENLFRLKHEFRALANLEHDNFVRLGELASDGTQLYFTMERIHGSDFLGYVRPDHGSPAADSGVQAHGSTRVQDSRLRAALVQLVDGLAALHEAGQVHRDVKPSNVLVTTAGRVVLLDFGLTARLGASDEMVGTPAFMAPEQILGEALTPAADWYAVGAMLYASLTGRLPFEGDALEVLQAKLDFDLRADFPSDTPDDLRDLCLSLLQRDAAARPGLEAIRGRLGIARSRGEAREVFVGRERELGVLRDALSDARGATRCLVVRGEAGMGKSALVERFLAGVPDQAFVLRGRCYEQERVPFGGVDSLVDALSDHLLGLGAKDVDRLVAGGVSNVTRVFPVLCRVREFAAQHSDGPILNAATLREQAFGELIRVVAGLARSRMLIVFLDDLQWIDESSLALIRQIVASKAVRCLFLATMRSEGAPSAAVKPALESLLDGFQRVDLSRLSSDESNDVCRALATLDAETREAVLREAGGHPLFLAELLRSARAGKLAQHASARLQDVLWDRISERSPVERRFIEMASLAGAPTPYAVLAQAAGLNVGECSTRLAGLRAAQLIRVSRVDDERCVEPYHDRVREAVMERLRAEGDGRIARLHLALGRALCSATPETKLAARIFVVVEHLKAGGKLADSDRERREFARLNLLASRQAYLTTAFDRARGYASFGLELLGADGWATAYPICRDLHLAHMEAAHVLGDHDAARATFDAARARLRDREEKTALYSAWIGLETTGGRFEEAIRAGREILEELGTRPPARTTKMHVMVEYAKTRWVQRGRSPDALATLPESRDATTQAVLQTLTALCPATYFGDPDLFSWILLRIARTSMEAGVSSESSTGIVGYGMVLSGVFGKRDEGAAFGHLGTRLADRFVSPRMQPEAHFVNGAFLLPWVRPFREAIESLQRGLELAQKYGVTKDEIYSAAMQVSHLYNAGVGLRELKERAEWARDLALQRNSDHIASQPDMVIRYADVLLGQAPGIGEPSLPRSGMSEFTYQVIRADLAYRADDCEGAEKHLAACAKNAEAVFCQTHLVEYCLLRALVSARRCGGAPVADRARRLAEIALDVRKLEAWARSCPDNFEPHARLAKAEWLRVTGRARAAAAAYDRAIESARERRSPKREALACELAMRHAVSRSDAAAAGYRALAADAQRRWGGAVRARELEASAPRCS